MDRSEPCRSMLETMFVITGRMTCKRIVCIVTLAHTMHSRAHRSKERSKRSSDMSARARSAQTNSGLNSSKVAVLGSKKSTRSCSTIALQKSARTKKLLRHGRNRKSRLDTSVMKRSARQKFSGLSSSCGQSRIARSRRRVPSNLVSLPQLSMANTLRTASSAPQHMPLSSRVPMGLCSVGVLPRLPRLTVPATVFTDCVDARRCRIPAMTEVNRQAERRGCG
mmetsp:Transcript_83719/g.270694  ORF Transcript_83719/g.270694 Transcript_83719/m.270694 type:complete len:223 (+) Transcript_83719:148-816(+)